MELTFNYYETLTPEKAKKHVIFKFHNDLEKDIVWFKPISSQFDNFPGHPIDPGSERYFGCELETEANFHLGKIVSDNHYEWLVLSLTFKRKPTEQFVLKPSRFVKRFDSLNAASLEKPRGRGRIYRYQVMKVTTSSSVLPSWAPKVF